MITATNNDGAAAEIRRQVHNFVNAFRAQDVDLMMTLFSPDLISFDIIPPLQYSGADAYRKVWQETFALFQPPIDIEIRDLHIAANDDLAFSYCFLRLHARMVNGREIDYWERLTCCFRKTGGNWLIVHEHVSLPADLHSGRAVMDLHPA